MQQEPCTRSSRQEQPCTRVSQEPCTWSSQELQPCTRSSQEQPCTRVNHGGHGALIHATHEQPGAVGCSHEPRTAATARIGQAPGELGVWSAIVARLRSAALAAKRCQEQGTRNVSSNKLQHRRRWKNLMNKPKNSQKLSLAVNSAQAQV